MYPLRVFLCEFALVFCMKFAKPAAVRQDLENLTSSKSVETDFNLKDLQESYIAVYPESAEFFKPRNFSRMNINKNDGVMNDDTKCMDMIYASHPRCQTEPIPRGLSQGCSPIGQNFWDKMYSFELGNRCVRFCKNSGCTQCHNLTTGVFDLASNPKKYREIQYYKDC